MHRFLFQILVLLLFVSCAKEDKLTIDVSGIEAKADIIRFDQAFYMAQPENLSELKESFPYLFPEQTPDSIWIAKMQDTDEQELFTETQKSYQDLNNLESQLEDLFKHIKYYYPSFSEPQVITMLSNVDYRSKIVYADEFLFISLDVFLGSESKIYQDYPDYIKNNFTKDHIITAVAEALSRREIPITASRTFLARSIQEGKLLYMLDAFLPNIDDTYKIGYSQQQLEWADFNDIDVWKFFIQNKFLFSTDQELSRRFIEEAPFSKFYRANDNESPGRIGVWFGWQIVRAYMQHNDVSLQEMLQKDAETIFKNSKYKPTK